MCDVFLSIGIGDVKVQRLWEALHEPFVRKPGSGGGESAASSSPAKEAAATTAIAATATDLAGDDAVGYGSDEEFWTYGNDDV